MLWWSAEVPAGWRIISKCVVWVRATATLCHSPVPSCMCYAPWGSDWCFSLLLTPALLWAMEKIGQLLFPGWYLLHMKPCRWINSICFLPTVSTSIWSCWGLDWPAARMCSCRRSSRTHCPSSQGRGRWVHISWWAVHPGSDPSSPPVSLRVSSADPSLPVLLGLERFALQVKPEV